MQSQQTTPVNIWLPLSIFKDQCNHIVDLYSSAKIVVSKGKLPLPTISYPCPQLVTLFNFKSSFLLNLNNKHKQVKHLYNKGLCQKSIKQFVTSYPLPTISYPYPQLVTLYPQLVTLSSSISYPLPTISYPYASKRCFTTLKTNLLLKLLKFFKNLVINQKVLS